MSAAPTRHARVAHIMGTAMSVHVLTRGALPACAAQAVDGCFALLREYDRVFSPYSEASQISLIRRGLLPFSAAAPCVAEVADSCAAARDETYGLFDAWRDGWFDPTGYVKGWAAEVAARTWLHPLLAHDGIVAVGINAGGDLQLATAAGEDWTWQVGVADPHRPGQVVATIEVRDGAVATSGLAERGTHILDPRTGLAAAGIASATVVAEGLAVADVWATASVVAGSADAALITRAPVLSTMLVLPDGGVRRWVRGVEVVAADCQTPTAA